MHAFEVQRQIAASPEAIWAVLTDARQLERGAFGITRLEGDIVPGGTLKLWSTVAPQRGFPLQVTAMEPPADDLERRHAARPVSRRADLQLDTARRCDPVCDAGGLFWVA